MDSNHRRRKPADLQSAPFGHSGNCPFCFKTAPEQRFHSIAAASFYKKRLQSYVLFSIAKNFSSIFLFALLFFLIFLYLPEQGINA